MFYGQNGSQVIATEMASRPLKATYNLATLGAKTLQGSAVVTATSGMEIEGHPIAQIGDRVRYPDGSETTIVSGAGRAAMVENLPVVIEGSALENGDTIISSLQHHAQIHEFEGEPISGLLQPGYVVPEAA